MVACAWLIFPQVLYPIFHLSPTAGDITTMMLTFVGVFLPLRAFDTVNTVGVLRGGGDVRVATLIDIIPMWCVSIPLVRSVRSGPEVGHFLGLRGHDVGAFYKICPGSHPPALPGLDQ